MTTRGGLGEQEARGGGGTASEQLPLTGMRWAA